MKDSPGKILFSIDLEEFDIPEEYGQHIPLQTKMEVSLEGMKSLEKLMEKNGVTSTIFSTAFWAQHHADYVRRLATSHEIASHTYYHDRLEPGDLAKSRSVLTTITGKEIAGVRMPLMQDIDPAEVSAAGYLYDSSLHPTWMPGRYNHLRSNRTVHRVGNLWVLPASVTPVARFPVFWLTFKNMPGRIYKRMCKIILRKDGYLVFYVHPWEFSDLTHYKLPAMIKRRSGQELLDRLDQLLAYFRKEGYTFETHEQFIRSRIAASG